MKILTVRFENLNSLEGEWLIDFRHPAYENTSIFAITGPTGSGKTTLLDAICLALYGRTPRLKTISKSSNELLTRQTGHCYAEVVFATVKGRYRCHWSQHRARKRSGGELQQPRHEIVDDQSDELLENKIKNVAAAVEEVTGMNFDQFTRSILLAQGSFAAFLLASPDQRSPLLEQITGTSIYSAISRKVHERTSSQEREFTRRSEELGALEVLSEDERQALQQRLEDNTGRAQRLTAALAETQKHLSWYDILDGLRAEVSTLEKEMARLQTDEEQEAPKALRLTRARNAANLLPEHQNLIKINSLQLQEREEQQVLAAEALRQEKRIEALERDRNEAHRLLEEMEKTAEQEKKEATAVRTLDVKIAEERLQWRKEHHQQKELQLQKNQSSARLETQRRLIDETSAEYHRLQKYCQDHADDAVLAERFTGIEERIEILLNLKAKEKQLLQRIGEHTSRLRKAEKSEADIRRAHAQAAERYSAAAKLQRTLAEDIAALRSDYPGLMQQQQDTSDRLHTLEKIAELLAQSKEHEGENKFCDNKEKELGVKLEKTQQRLTRLGERGAAQEKIVQQQEEIVLLASRIKNYEQERNLLQAGRPCPLCGSRQHPFADQVPYEGEHLGQRLETEKRALAELNSQLTEETGALATLRSELAENTKTQSRAGEQYHRCRREMATLCAGIGFDADSGIDGSLEQERRMHTLRLGELKQVSEKLEKLENEAAGLRRKTDGLLQEQHDLDRRLGEAVYTLEGLRRKTVELAEQKEELGADISRRQLQLQEEISVFGLSAGSEEELTDIQKSLAARLQKWKSAVTAKERLASERLAAEGAFEKEQVLHNRLVEDLGQKNEVVSGLAQSLEQLVGKRLELYGDKDPDSEEAALAQRVKEAGSRLRELDSSLSAEIKAQLVLQDRQQRLEQSTADRETLRRRLESDFARKLRARGFEQTDDFGDALLPAERVDQLEFHLQKLQAEKTRTATLFEEKRKALALEEAKNHTAKERKTLLDESEERSRELQVVHEESGRLQGRLEENEQRLLQQQKKRETLAAQKRELQRWRRLDELIGSANGKKFRNFAQGITFESMVVQANRSLRKMTDRYLLVRDEIHPLELNIIDNYRGGDIRTTQNLSGGESFLVSLALALGLSKMAGKNVRVDSLFLDEGFGTLDEETLDTALQTLAGLRQEGKTIGIISHVALLKEKLETRIQVIPGRGGHSILKGPGIVRVCHK